MTLKVLSNGKMRCVETGINRSVLIICLVGRCPFPALKGHHHDRIINVLSVFSIYRFFSAAANFRQLKNRILEFWCTHARYTLCAHCNSDGVSQLRTDDPAFGVQACCFGQTGGHSIMCGQFEIYINVLFCFQNISTPPKKSSLFLSLSCFPLLPLKSFSAIFYTGSGSLN